MKVRSTVVRSAKPIAKGLATGAMSSAINATKPKKPISSMRGMVTSMNPSQKRRSTPMMPKLKPIPKRQLRSPK